MKNTEGRHLGTGVWRNIFTADVVPERGVYTAHRQVTQKPVSQQGKSQRRVHLRAVEEVLIPSIENTDSVDEERERA